MTERGPDSLPTTSLGHYRVRAKIGSGGMGDVFDAVHTGLNKRVAIKTLRKRFLDDEVVVARFLREGQLASRIRHPNIVDITDVGMMGGLPCLVMEHLEGESFSAMIRREGYLQVETIVDVLLPIVAAVDFAHEHGIVHRDLKPSNIFLSRSWNGEIVPKVLDFGISKLVHDSQQAALTTDSAFVGTPHYASPELMRADKLADGRSDQYSLGVILYEAATGVRPFADLGNNFVALAMAICKGEYPSIRQRNANVPVAFEQVVQRAMALKVQDRFATMRALGAALLPFASQRVRMIWAPTFEGQGSAAQPATEALSCGPASTGTVATVASAAPFSQNVPAAGPHSTPPHAAAPHPGAPHSGAPHSAPAHTMAAHPAPPHLAAAQSVPPYSAPPSVGSRASTADAPPSQHTPHGMASVPSGEHAGLAGSPWGAPAYPSGTPSGAAVDRMPSYGAGTSAPPVTRARGSGAITAVIGLSLGLAVLASVIVLRTSRRDDGVRTAAASVADTFTLDLQVTPSSALIEIDGAVVGTGRASKTLARDGRNHVLRLSAPGYESLLVEFKDTSPPPAVIGLRPVPAPNAAGHGAPDGQTAPPPAQGGPSPGHRTPVAGPVLASPPPTKTKGTEGRPKTDNIDPWE